LFYEVFIIMKMVITESQYKRLINESGIRNINELAKRYKKAKIYFHQDLDGVTTAIAMKAYLENQGIKVVDAEIIQYGDKEWSIKKPDASGDVMPVLVDFAHGKPMFVIHTDHHDSQAGVESGTSTSFKSSRSNVETISQSISPKELFSNDDIILISTVDSANYAVQNISPEQVMSYLFTFDKDSTLKRNKMLMGLVTNKLLLAFKNKPGFLETLVLDCTPSLLNILLRIKQIVQENGYADIPQLEKNKEDYVSSMKSHKNVEMVGNIIKQYGGGSMFKPGSYDRYTPFRNNPEADFIVLAWPMGLVQASCNPFKESRALKGVNLGEIKDEVLSRWESQLKSKEIPLSTIKWVSESGMNSESVGFTFKDFVALYGDKFKQMGNGQKLLEILGNMMTKPFKSLSPKQIELMDKITINAWDLIQSNSGGHKCITNISGLNYLGRPSRPGKNNKAEGEDSASVKFTKMIQDQFVKVLQDKINNQ
jgi:hypothetical protein